MQNEDVRESPRRGRRAPTELERLIPMVGLFMSGLEDWRSASKGKTGKRCPACGSELDAPGRR